MSNFSMPVCKERKLPLEKFHRSDDEFGILWEWVSSHWRDVEDDDRTDCSDEDGD